MALQANALLDLGEMKTALKLEDSKQDERLTTLINAASDWYEGKFRRRLKTRAYTNLRVDGRGGQILMLEWPITAVTSLVLDETAQTIWTPGDAGEPKDKDVFIEEDPDDRIGRHSFYRWDGWTEGKANIKISYTAGYGVDTGTYKPVIPEDLKQAVIILCRHWFFLLDRQRQGIQSISRPGETVQYLTTQIPEEAKAIIDSPIYRRAPELGAI